ncbi:hypothetical protein KUV50_12540 [Membranicola marinus]|uniref:Transposase IS200-like domain-containing protein n=1 Tax=Membranihabitans marinus TaxID=1227546 RepID=A0A953HVJ9_9BACT|nr:hypothetical protein [Membranihabitans marinus]MBY5958971.1 hypothetical protein [Membranihabitans marinus]
MPSSTDISLPLLPGQAYHIYNRGNEKRQIFFQEDNFSYFLKRYQDYVKDYMDTYAYCLLDNHFHICVRVKSGEEVIASAKDDESFKLDRHFVQRYVMPHLKTIGVKADAARDAGTADLTDLGAASDAADLTDLQDLLNLKPHLLPHSLQNNLITEYDLHPEKITNLPFETQLGSYIVSQRLRRFLLSYAKSINKQQDRTGSLFQKTFRRRWIATDEDLKSVITYIHHNVIHHGYNTSYDGYPWSSYQEYVSDNENAIVCKKGLSLFGSKKEFIRFSADFQTKKIEEMEFK